MQRTIPVVSNGNTEYVSLYDKPVTASAPPAQTERVNLSHHIEAPTAREAREWAWGALVGGAILAASIDVVATFGALSTKHPAWGWIFVGAWLLAPIGYMTPLVFRFMLLHQFDTRTREAMPPPRTRVEVKGKADNYVIEGRSVASPVDPAKVLHAKKLLALVLWATSVEYNDKGEVIKEYGKAPAFRRDNEGRRELPVEGTNHIIRQEEQKQLNDELAAVGIFTKHPHPTGWGLTDMTWTRKHTLELMKVAFP